MLAATMATLRSNLIVHQQNNREYREKSGNLTQPTVMVVRYHLTILLDPNIQIVSVALHDPSPPVEWIDLPVWTILTMAMAPELDIHMSDRYYVCTRFTIRIRTRNPSP